MQPDFPLWVGPDGRGRPLRLKGGPLYDSFFGVGGRGRERDLNGSAGDLARAVEAEAGANWDWWFEQWIHAAGYPSLEVSFAWNAEERQDRPDDHREQEKLSQVHRPRPSNARGPGASAVGRSSRADPRR